MRSTAVFLGLLAIASPATAQQQCGQLSDARMSTADHAGTWAEATAAQYHFLQGIFAMNPMTPPGLPYGDHAALATVPDREGALVLFVDGERACAMPVPKELLEMLRDVESGKTTHEGQDN